MQLSRRQTIVESGASRIRTAEGILGTANNLLDGSARYSSGVVEACLLAFQSLQTTLAEERNEADQSAKLGPMLPEDYTSARRIFLEDLAAR
jgi:hypothetical protein